MCAYCLCSQMSLIDFGACQSYQPQFVDMYLQLVRALLSAGAMVMSYNMRGYAPLHTAIAGGKRPVVEALMKYHENRKLSWQTLCVRKSNDTPLHVAVRALRVPAARHVRPAFGLVPGRHRWTPAGWPGPVEE